MSYFEIIIYLLAIIGPGIYGEGVDVEGCQVFFSTLKITVKWKDLKMVSKQHIQLLFKPFLRQINEKFKIIRKDCLVPLTVPEVAPQVILIAPILVKCHKRVT